MTTLPPPVATEALRKRTKLFMVGALVVAGIAFAVVAASRINNNLVYYWTPSDLRHAGEKAYGATIRLGGQVVPGSVQMHGISGLDFDMTDKKQNVHVRASGIPPQMFREGIGVVVEGTMDRSGSFLSDRLMVSHNNEYRAPKSGEKVDAKTLIGSTDGIAAKGGK